MDLQLLVFRKIADGDAKAFEMLFKEYYKFLCSYAYGVVKEKYSAEEIVEEFFVNLWNNRQNLIISTSVRSYFITSVHNRCLNYLQREKPKFTSAGEIIDLINKENIAGNRLITLQAPTLLINELESALEKAMQKLPDSCREIFLLSRTEQLSYKEIADKLHISVNTVKTQIRIALGKLRGFLKDYLPLLFFFLFR